MSKFSDLISFTCASHIYKAWLLAQLSCQKIDQLIQICCWWWVVDLSNQVQIKAIVLEIRLVPRCQVMI